MAPPKDPIKYEEWRKKQSLVRKGWIPPNSWIEKRRGLNKGNKHSPEAIQKIIDARKKQVGINAPTYGKKFTEEHKQKISKAHTGKKQSELAIKKMAEKRRGWIPSNEWREKQRIAHTGQKRTKETCKKISARIITEEHRRRISEANTLDTTEKKYCWKNRDVTPRVRAFYNYMCVLCGSPENGKKHIHHHVYYDKKACCLIDIDGTYVSTLGLKYNPNPFKIIGDPNKFILLCRSCHGKTNGKLQNREKWARYFETIINCYYGGKSYLTTEEMNAYIGRTII
jgi:hypothetical protein